MSQSAVLKAEICAGIVGRLEDILKELGSASRVLSDELGEPALANEIAHVVAVAAKARRSMLASCFEASGQVTT